MSLKHNHGRVRSQHNNQVLLGAPSARCLCIRLLAFSSRQQKVIKRKRFLGFASQFRISKLIKTSLSINTFHTLLITSTDIKSNLLKHNLCWCVLSPDNNHKKPNELRETYLCWSVYTLQTGFKFNSVHVYLLFLLWRRNDKWCCDTANMPHAWPVLTTSAMQMPC